jgi:hypothetical protein
VLCIGSLLSRSSDEGRSLQSGQIHLDNVNDTQCAFTDVMFTAEDQIANNIFDTLRTAPLWLSKHSHEALVQAIPRYEQSLGLTLSSSQLKVRPFETTCCFDGSSVADIGTAVP